MLPRWILGLAIVIAGTASTYAAEPVVRAEQLPRVPPTEPDKAISTFRVKPGFRIELVAAEPLVVDPIAISFDEDGRCYVVEMRDYSERRPERLGRIRRLEDTNGDGRFDKSTVFAADMPWPTAVICWDGGVFVGATPDIIYFKDTNGDGVADIREPIFTGFAADFAPFATNKLNVQALMNSFNWSLDNRIHGATSFNGGKVKRVDSPFVRDWLKRISRSAVAAGVSPAVEPGVPPGGTRVKTAHAEQNLQPTPGGKMPPSTAGETPAATLDLRGRDFSFDPRTLEMRAESGGGQHGMSFDNRGRKYVCSNSSHLQTLMYEERYAARNPYSSLPRALVDIAVDGGAAPVFRISPDEPWRVIRTQWRVSGLVSGPVEGGGRPSGYFTGATGVTIYRGDAFGAEYLGDAFVGDAGGNLVHRKEIFKEGESLKAARPKGEETVEFLASTDNWFRPVQMGNAPDGCLYICDMYREVIEHPWSLPDSIKKHLDLNSGNDRGRIYRVVPENFKQPKVPRLGKASTKKLVAMLTLANGWHRDTAARLLYERQPKAAIPELTELARTSPLPMIRNLALSSLNGLGAFTEDAALRAFADDSAEVRAHALRLSEVLLQQPRPSTRLEEGLAQLVQDEEHEVRRQLAFTLGWLSPQWRIRLALAIAKGHRFYHLANELGSSFGNEAGMLFQQLAGADESLGGWTPLYGNLVFRIGAENRSGEVSNVVEALAYAGRQAPRNGYANWSLLGIANRLAAGLERNGQTLANTNFQDRLAPIFALAHHWAMRLEMHEGGGVWPAAGNPRRAALSALAYAPSTEAVPVLLSVIQRYPTETRSALTAMARHLTPQVTANLLEFWPRLTVESRNEVADFLLKRTETSRAFLDAVGNGRLKRTELSAAQVEFLRTHRDPVLRTEAARLLAPERDRGRQEVMKAFEPALSLRGDSRKGATLFEARCTTCHQLRGTGHALGPDLATVANAGKEKILVNILDPNREVNANYVSYAIETKDGESLVGLIVGENATAVTLRMAGGTETQVPRAKIASMQSQGRSLMPEGLEEGMTMQNMADLLEFILAP